MYDQTLKTACAVWGAVLSTMLGLVKLWEVFWKDRVRLKTTYSFSTQEGSTDEITIVNLSSVPVQVSRWELAWKPKSFHWCTSTIDVTPHEGTSIFTVGPKDNHTICFEEDSKFDWSYRSTGNRALCLTLHIFGRRRPKVLRVGVWQ